MKTVYKMSEYILAFTMDRARNTYVGIIMGVLKFDSNKMTTTLRDRSLNIPRGGPEENSIKLLKKYVAPPLHMTIRCESLGCVLGCGPLYNMQYSNHENTCNSESLRIKREQPEGVVQYTIKQILNSYHEPSGFEWKS